ncbi:hypothetical protein [Wenxinia marina]|uniref:Uncharacterized protein n=1 Tax=Wenxinia marina DSM 24838 TaxID=1123501 RepID=A0A0D0Q092_9RHOB|nr:hypothetical protein [Wenxinia marina]KIQ68019.1 hypothetical protein Wenmar_03475 [Wenxinia marina DSM 24838]GGL75343.1 hypothetical protein GCM10011392_32510 [Wenxinia marina]
MPTSKKPRKKSAATAAGKPDSKAASHPTAGQSRLPPGVDSGAQQSRTVKRLPLPGKSRGR